jgi:hypothetical protein
MTEEAVTEMDGGNGINRRNEATEDERSSFFSWYSFSYRNVFSVRVSVSPLLLLTPFPPYPPFPFTP